MPEERQPMSEDGPGRSKLRARRPWIVAGLLLLAWVLAGLRTVEPDSFGVLQGPLFLGAARQVDGRWVIAPPGLLRLSVYPRRGVELPLPQAEQAMLRAPDGSRYGFRGWITLRARPEEWRALHAASAGRGIEGALLDAVRAASETLGPSLGGAILPPTAERAFERRLVEELAQRGLDLRILDLDAIDFLTVSVDRRGALPDTRLLVIGLDGADWEILDPLMEQGRLPNLKRLVDNGARAKLLSISPLLSPVIWTTIATGVEPSRHGIIDFLVEDPDGGQQQPVTSVQRQVPTFWELLSRRGVPVGVVGWWASWPADPVRGYLVSDRLAYQLFGFRADPDDAQGKTWPPDLYSEIRPLIVEPESVGWERVETYLDGPRRTLDQFEEEERHLLDEFRTLLASGDTYMAINERLRRKFKPALELIYLEGTDTVGHLFMSYRPPPLPGVDPEGMRSFSQMVDRYCEQADRMIGRLLEERDEHWTVLVVSDHGFATDTTRPRSTDSRIGHGAAADWHRRFGVILLSGAHVRPGVRLEEATVFDVAPTVMALFGEPIPASWPGRVLAGALTDEFFDEHPVHFRSDDPERGERQDSELADPAAADLVAKLESLGYIAGGGGSDSLSARNNAGVSFLAEGRLSEAEREFRAGLEANPGSVMLMVNLGLTLRLQGRFEEARELLLPALEDPTTLRMAGHTLAQIDLETGDLDEAERVARRVLEAEPDSGDLHNTLGLILERRGLAAEARQEYMTAAGLDPDAALPRNNLGNLAKKAGLLDEAESWYLRAIEADPYFMGAYNNLALVYQARGQMQRAIDLYDRALSKSPDNSVVLNNLASLYYATGEHDEARRLWRRAAAADPGYPSPLNNLASLELTEQNYDEAERLLRRAIELDAEYGDARINLALVYRARGDLEAAGREYRRAVEDSRTGANGWFQYGLFEMEQKRLESAVEAFLRGRGVAPRNTELLNALGEAYFRLGRRDEALETWRQSLAVDPGQARVREVLENLSAR